MNFTDEQLKAMSNQKLMLLFAGLGGAVGASAVNVVLNNSDPEAWYRVLREYEMLRATMIQLCERNGTPYGVIMADLANQRGIK